MTLTLSGAGIARARSRIVASSPGERSVWLPSNSSRTGEGRGAATGTGTGTVAVAGGGEGCAVGSAGIGPPTTAVGDPGRAGCVAVTAGAGDAVVLGGVAADVVPGEVVVPGVAPGGLFVAARGGRTTGGAAVRGVAPAGARAGGDWPPPAESKARISTETCDQAGDIRQAVKTSMMAAVRMQTCNG
jgi:hypothetical protein